MLGYMGSIFPECLGGPALGYVDCCIIVEELARVDPSRVEDWPWQAAF